MTLKNYQQLISFRVHLFPSYTGAFFLKRSVRGSISWVVCGTPTGQNSQFASRQPFYNHGRAIEHNLASKDWRVVAKSFQRLVTSRCFRQERMAFQSENKSIWEFQRRHEKSPKEESPNEKNPITIRTYLKSIYIKSTHQKSSYEKSPIEESPKEKSP